ncbi:MAG: M3 family oligoendopeptidase [Aggregatilineales bacterium]
MFDTFPTDYKKAMDWSWEQFEPYTQHLLDTEIGENNIDAWMRDWSTFRLMIVELYARLNVNSAVNTEDGEAEAQLKRFMSEIYPQVLRHDFAMNNKLIASEIVPDGMEVPMRGVRKQVELFREDNLPLIEAADNLRIEYSKISGAQTVEWEGDEKTLQQMSPMLKETDRARREKAWRLMQARILEDREQYDALWVKYMDIRKQIAHNAGFESYRDYVWQDLGRFDYTPEDALEFCDAIEQVVVPALSRLSEERRQKMGLDTLRPWDMAVDALGRDAMRPYETMDDFTAKTETIFKQVDPVLGDYFATMREENLLDLENRKAKRPGGFCTGFPVSQRPFIFMNAVGLDSDIRVLLHEAGHAFHGFYCFQEADYIQQMRAPMEFNEVASMAMELLASPYLTEDRGGYFTEAEADRFRKEHLGGIISFWPYMAVVVAFQHWIYTNHDTASDPAACDEKWRELVARFLPKIDWTGLEDVMINRWRKQLHIFLRPFYYVEYGLAQLGAVQVYANALEDQATALEQYRSALKLAGTAKLPDLYEAAGVKLAFDAETLGNAVNLLETQMASFTE